MTSALTSNTLGLKDSPSLMKVLKESEVRNLVFGFVGQSWKSLVFLSKQTVHLFEFRTWNKEVM